MNEIFLSYASADRRVAKKFADALESLGWSVWWDREIPVGTNFDSTIEEQLKSARCVVVLWSKDSVRSRWVRAEASSAAARNCLVPVLIDDVAIPLEFTLIQAAALTGWDGDTADPEFVRVVEAVRQMLGRSPEAPVEVKAKAKLKSKPRSGGLVWIVVAAAVVAALFLARTVFHRLSGAESDNAQHSANNTDSNTDARGARNTVPTRPPEGATPIKVGDKIADGVIKAPYDRNVYALSAAQGQRVYFRMLRHGNGMDQIRWQLVDPAGTEVFNTCLACTEPGVQTLTAAGAYTLSVGSRDNPATGTYEVQLFDVPAPSRFSIKIGDRIGENMPGPGAGIIESPGAEDIFTFTAAPRQRVYFRASEHSTGMDQIRWALVDENGMEVFSTCLACNDPGVQTLIKGGLYTLTLGHKTNPATGTYRVQLFNVPPPDQFTIKVGDRIRQGMPGPGAGVIETPGAEDVYSFTASPGQKVYFRVLEHGPGMDQMRWRLVDDNNMELFNTCLACGTPGVQTLTRGGSYMLIVGHPTNASTGTYAIEMGAK